jgi:hypothetical protein
VNRKQSLELARRDSALDRKSRRINDLGSSVPDNDASPDLFCPESNDQLHPRAGRLRNGAVFRGDNRTVSDFASNLNPASFASVSIHPTAAPGGSVSR